MKILVLISVLLFFGCASNTVKESVSLVQSLQSVQCGVREFRGAGFGIGEKEAVNAAQSELAKQIHSSITVSVKNSTSQNILNGKEELKSEYVSESIVQSTLGNIHDARVQHVESRVNETGAVVCMSRADAAKGFIEQQRLIMDSLKMSSNLEINTKHPKQKNDAWHKTQMLYNKFAVIQNLLNGWDVKSDYSADELYGKTQEDYKDYCKGSKVHWEDAGNECSEAIFSILSKNVKMEKSLCESGLKIIFSCAEKCKSFSFGIECSAEPSLSIESCGGESYSLLRVKEPITGSDMNNQQRAKEKFIENLSNPIFLKEWETEIMEWVPKCADN